MTLARKIRIGITFTVAAVLAGLMVWHEFNTANKAKLLTEKGQTAVAEVTHASVKTKRKYGISTRTATVDYNFTTEGGQNVSGSGSVPAELVDSLTDPDDDTMLRADAIVEVLYLPESPGQNNGIKAEMTDHQEPDWMVPVVVFLIGGFVTFVVVGRIMRFTGANA